jgi:hypothetical protein
LLAAWSLTAATPPRRRRRSAAGPRAPSREIYELRLAVDLPSPSWRAARGWSGLLRGGIWPERAAPAIRRHQRARSRHPSGNHSAAAGIAANVTVYGVMAALPLADLLDLGWRRAWGEDLAVYAETLAIDTAPQNAFELHRRAPATPHVRR